MIGFSFMGSFVSIMVFLIFGIVIVGFIVVFIKVVSQWHSNNQSPRLTVDAEVVSRYHSDGEDSTTFYVVFQVDSGDRMEFVVPRSEYGFLVEGDRGRLTFQGTRYLGFKRQ